MTLTRNQNQAMVAMQRAHQRKEAAPVRKVTAAALIRHGLAEIHRTTHGTNGPIWHMRLTAAGHDYINA